MTHAILQRFSCHLLSSTPRLQYLHHFPIERSQTSKRSQFLQETASISCSQFASMCLTWKVKLHELSLRFCLAFPRGLRLLWVCASASCLSPLASNICIHLFVSAFRCCEVLKVQSCYMFNFVPLPPKNSLYARRKQTEPRGWQEMTRLIVHSSTSTTSTFPFRILVRVPTACICLWLSACVSSFSSPSSSSSDSGKSRMATKPVPVMDAKSQLLLAQNSDNIRIDVYQPYILTYFWPRLVSLPASFLNLDHPPPCHKRKWKHVEWSVSLVKK